MYPPEDKVSTSVGPEPESYIDVLSQNPEPEIPGLVQRLRSSTIPRFRNPYSWALPVENRSGPDNQPMGLAANQVNLPTGHGMPSQSRSASNENTLAQQHEGQEINSNAQSMGESMEPFPPYSEIDQTAQGVAPLMIPQVHMGPGQARSYDHASWEAKKNVPEYSIFVGHLGKEVDEALLWSFFAPRYQSFIKANLMRDRTTGLSRGFAFIRFTDIAERNHALEHHDGALIGVSKIMVGIAKKELPKGDLQRQEIIKQSLNHPVFQSSGNMGPEPPHLNQQDYQHAGAFYQHRAPIPPQFGQYGQYELSGNMAPVFPPSVVTPAQASSFFHPGPFVDEPMAFPAPGIAGSPVRHVPHQQHHPGLFYAPSHSNAPELLQEPHFVPGPMAQGPYGSHHFGFPPGAYMHGPQFHPSGSYTQQGQVYNGPTMQALDFGPELEEHAHPNNVTVFVGGLAEGTTEEYLRYIFQTIGDVRQMNIPSGMRCAFVRFANHTQARVAIKCYQGLAINGKRVRLSWGRPASAK